MTKLKIYFSPIIEIIIRFYRTYKKIHINYELHFKSILKLYDNLFLFNNF